MNINRLFTIDDNYELELNKPWIMMVPEFNEILKKDKGSPGDYRGEKKTMARKKLGYVYLMHDYQSPFRKMEHFERRDTAMKMTNLTEKDLNDADIPPAEARYKKIQYDSAPALRTLDAITRGMSSMNNYFENVDFNQTDKMGRLLFSPMEFNKNISEVKKAYESIAEFNKMVEEQLTNAPEVRGEVELGDLEGTPNKFNDLLDLVAKQNRKKTPEPEFDEDGEPIQVVTMPVAANKAAPKFGTLGAVARASMTTDEGADSDGVS